jgi:hypothetical protein
MERRRPRVSRETRLLLGIVLLSLAALWVLARMRFPNRPSSANPVPPILAQLAPASPFDVISSTIRGLEPVLSAVLVAVDFDPGGSPGNIERWTGALRLDDDLALTLAPDNIGHEMLGTAKRIVALDVASRLALVRVARGAAPRPPLTTARFSGPGFLVAADVLPGGVSARPVFVGSLFPVDLAAWAKPAWSLPSDVRLRRGTFMFALDGALAGMVVDRGDRQALMEGQTLLSAASRMHEDEAITPGDLGVQVQPLTEDVGRAVGASTGVLVAWVDPNGPAAGALLVADVIEAMGDQRLATLEQWQARLTRIRAGEPIILGVRRRGALHDVTITAGSRAVRLSERPLGLTLRRVPGVGVAVLSVNPDSAAADAKIQAGDVITLIGEVSAPTASQVARLFAAGSSGPPLPVALTRGQTHLIVALEPREPRQ